MDMHKKKKILLKLTGELFLPEYNTEEFSLLTHIIQQLHELQETHQFGIVIGGGNFFRGALQSKELKIGTHTGHYVGMLATMMNGLIFQDRCEQRGIKTTLLSALACPSIAQSITPQIIHQAIKQEDTVLIFCGGTGNPFFTTDTTAVIRSLQLNAQEVWKATKVDGLYTADPKKVSSAQFIQRMNYAQVLEQKLSIMDLPAFALAQEHGCRIRIFNIFTKNALIQAAHDTNFGSTIV